MRRNLLALLVSVRPPVIERLRIDRLRPAAAVDRREDPRRESAFDVMPRLPAGWAITAALLAATPAHAEPADVSCVYLALGCATPAPPLPTVLPGPLYAPAVPSAEPRITEPILEPERPVRHRRGRRARASARRQVSEAQGPR